MATYRLESEFRTLDFVRGTISDARKRAVDIIGSKNKIIYVFRGSELIGLVRDWYGKYQWATVKGASSFVNKDGSLRR